MRVIDTINAPGAIGPYSQAFEVLGLIITSGQIPSPHRPNRAAKTSGRSWMLPAAPLIMS